MEWHSYLELIVAVVELLEVVSVDMDLEHMHLVESADNYSDSLVNIVAYVVVVVN